MQDPSGDTKRQMVERFSQSPQIMGVEMAMAAKEFGYPDAAIQGFMQMVMQATQPQPGPGQGRPPNAGPPPPQPGAAMAPQTPDELAMLQQQEAAMGNVPGPERPPNSAGMSLGGRTGGGFS